MVVGHFWESISQINLVKQHRKGRNISKTKSLNLNLETLAGITVGKTITKQLIQWPARCFGTTLRKKISNVP